MAPYSYFRAEMSIELKKSDTFTLRS